MTSEWWYTLRIRGTIHLYIAPSLAVCGKEMANPMNNEQDESYVTSTV